MQAIERLQWHHDQLDIRNQLMIGLRGGRMIGLRCDTDHLADVLTYAAKMVAVSAGPATTNDAGAVDAAGLLANSEFVGLHSHVHN